VDELRTAVDGFRTETDTKLTTELQKLTRRLDEIDARSQRPGAPGGQRDEAAEVEKRAVVGFIRRGRESLPDAEVRALRVAVDTLGGFLAPRTSRPRSTRTSSCSRLCGRPHASARPLRAR
jgi:HK97 family phage major capsid protein